MDTPRDQIRIRMYVILTLLTLLPFAVVFKVLHIHLTESAELREEGRRQASSFREIPALRGTLLDREGRVLATTTARYDLALDPTTRGFSERESVFFERLSSLTGVPASTFRQRVRQRTSTQYVMLYRGLTEPQKDALMELGIPGLITEERYSRRYTYGTLASHVLGHVGTDGSGLSGLELRYNAFLEGQPGRRAVKRDRRGQVRAFVGGAVIEPRHGQNLKLTLDLVRQSALEEELARGLEESGGNWAAAVALDPHTGAILAMANVPTYDPNTPGDFPEAARRNRAITDQFEPGSTFKLVPAVAAVELGKVQMDEVIDTGNGSATFSGRLLTDSQPFPQLSFTEVMAQSSNVGIGRIAQRLSSQDLFRFARALGFGQFTYVDLPGETNGVLRNPTQWSGTSHISVSIGYEVSVTTLQLATAYAALANGGRLLQPYVVEERQDLSGRTVWRARQDSVRRAFSERTTTTLLPAFQEVVASGTARRAQMERVSVAGKTGTARIATAGGYTRAYRSSFVGFFPAENPQVVIAIVVDNPQAGYAGGHISAPIFQRVAERWLRTFPSLVQQVAQAAPLPDEVRNRPPAIAQLPGNVAAQRILAAGYRVSHPERYQWAQHLVPTWPDSQRIPVRTTLKVRTQEVEPSTERMPNLIGLSARQARYWLSQLGVEVVVRGHGQVVAQYPRPGAVLTARTEIRCE